MKRMVRKAKKNGGRGETYSKSSADEYCRHTHTREESAKKQRKAHQKTVKPANRETKMKRKKRRKTLSTVLYITAAGPRLLFLFSVFFLVLAVLRVGDGGGWSNFCFIFYLHIFFRFGLVSHPKSHARNKETHQRSKAREEAEASERLPLLARRTASWTSLQARHLRQLPNQNAKGATGSEISTAEGPDDDSIDKQSKTGDTSVKFMAARLHKHTHTQSSVRPSSQHFRTNTIAYRRSIGQSVGRRSLSFC